MSSTAIKQRAIKDPDAILDYTMSWAGWLEDGEEIVQSEWEITGDDAELVEGSADYASTFSTSAATIWLSGGTAGLRYTITNRITTDNVPPRVDDRSILVTITQK